jgi:hypothetical protein
MNLELLQKLKVLALLEMHHAAWTDTTRFQRGEKSKLCRIIQAKFDSMTPEAITAEFNDTVNETLFQSGAALDKYPILR